MKSRFPLRLALGLVAFYSLVTVSFIDGPSSTDRRPDPAAEKVAALPDSPPLLVRCR